MWNGPATLRSSVRFTWCGAGAGAGVGGSIGAGGLAVLAFVDAEKTMKATAIKIENCIFAIASLTFFFLLLPWCCVLCHSLSPSLLAIGER